MCGVNQATGRSRNVTRPVQEEPCGHSLNLSHGKAAAAHWMGHRLHASGEDPHMCVPLIRMYQGGCSQTREAVRDPDITCTTHCVCKRVI